jgi:hypothetical protein
MSEVAICNEALSHIGAYSITSLTEQSKEARQCNILYASARDQALRDFPWNFAEKRVALALLSSVTPTGYDYAYAYPPDCLKAREIYNSVTGGEKIDFIINAAADGKSKMILTDEEDAILIHTMRITNTEVFDGTFKKALGYLLASELAWPITKKASIQGAMLEIYSSIISTAKAGNASEGRDSQEVDNPFIAARS